MENLKFRGRKITSKEWIYGNLSLSKIANPIIYKIGDKSVLMPSGFIDGWSFEVQKESIGQFIGLTDKNGVELYSGDIVVFEYHQYILKGTISFDQFNHSIILVDNKEYHIENVKRGEKIGTI